MKRTLIETAAVAVVLLGTTTAVVLPLRVEAHRRDQREAATRTIELTGVMAQGLWTDEAVRAAAWRHDFRRARPRLRVGETVRLRLASADVIHSFAAPELGIEPVEVYPGEIAEVTITPDEPGVFEYYCTTVCGEAHFAMRGFLEVVPAAGGEPGPLPERPGEGYWHEEAPPPGADRVVRGSWLYRQQGCVTCHGEEGAGGVPNPGSMNPVVPPLDDLAHRTFLFTPPDVAAFADVVGREPPLEALPEAAEVPLFPIVKKQYLATRRLVRDGRASAPLDVSSPRPPLDMPAWGARLPDDEIDAILVYLLSRGGGGRIPPAGSTPSPKGDPR